MSESFKLDLRLYNYLKLPLITIEHCKDDIISDVTFDDLCNWSISYLYQTKYDGKRNLPKLQNFLSAFELGKYSTREVYDSFFEFEVKGKRKEYDTKEKFETMYNNLSEKTIITRDELFNYCVYRFSEVFQSLVYSKFEIDHKLTNFILNNRMRVRSHDVKEK